MLGEGKCSLVLWLGLRWALSLRLLTSPVLLGFTLFPLPFQLNKMARECWSWMFPFFHLHCSLSQLDSGKISSFSSVLLSHIQLFVTPWTAAHQASLTNSITNSQSLLRLMSIKSVMLSYLLIFLSPSPPAFNLSQHQGLFKWVSYSHQVAKVLKLQLQHQSFQWVLRTDFL